MTRSVGNPPASIPDVEALRDCWHPVAYADALGSDPIRVMLLGDPVVLWRDSNGRPHALNDVCIHRGTALSLGRVIGDQLMCPYHGWRYGSDGRCKAIPQLADPTQVPGKARVAAYECTSRYGIVWVALGEPRWSLPEVPELETYEGWQVVRCGPYSWKSDASRQVENFTDFGHFPWVHAGLLGDPSRPVVPRHSVDIDGHVLRYEIVRPESPTPRSSRSLRTSRPRRPSAAVATSFTFRTRSCCGSAGVASEGWSTSSRPSRPATKPAPAT